MSGDKSDLSKYLPTPVCDVLSVRGITAEALADELFAELHADRTKFIKVKGTIPPKKKLPTGSKIVTESDEETLIEINVIDWATRQKAREDAHKLLNHYPKPFSGFTGELADGKIIVTCE